MNRLHPKEIAINRFLPWRSLLQFLELNESSLFLQLDPVALSKGSKEFPVTIYESTMDMVQDQVRLVFVKVSYKVETGEAERVAVDHVAKPSVSGGGADLGNTRKNL